MMDEQSFFSSTSSSLFDTYLVYGIIGLLTLIAIIGLIVLLATSCCCCYCCLSPKPRCLCCYRNRRHSSYKLSQNSKKNETRKIAFIQRHPSDVADFSQLYDSCPHLINSKAMASTGANMDTSCTTIDTLVSPISACSSFRSLVESGTLPKDNKPTIVQNNLSNPPQQNNVNLRSSSVKGACPRPFSYIKNTNDRVQIQRRFTQNERIAPEIPVLPQVSSSERDNNNQINIYETVLPTTNNNTPPPEVSVPIYDTEWTHNLRQIMIATSIEDEGVSIIQLPPVPPDLVPSINQSPDYFQQQNPYDKFLAGRSTTSDSTRRANMLRRLKDDAAFLY